MYVEISLTRPVSSGPSSAKPDQASLIALAHLAHERGLVVGMAHSLEDWKDVLREMDGTSAQLWRNVLRARGVGSDGSSEPCDCGRLQGFRFSLDAQPRVTTCCGRIDSPLTATMDGRWVSARNISNNGLEPNERYPANFTSRFSMLASLANRVILVDPYLVPDAQRELDRKVEPAFFKLLDMLGADWRGRIDIACQTSKAWNHATTVSTIRSWINGRMKSSELSASLLISGPGLHERIIGFQIGSINLSIALGKGLEPFSKKNRRITHHCAVTGDRQAQKFWAEAQKLKSGRLVNL